MGAEPVAENGVDGPKDTAGSRAASDSGVADRPARAPLRTAFTRLARFSTNTRRWHPVGPASRRRGGGAGEDVRAVGDR
jgi:hypothetical protein